MGDEIRKIRYIGVFSDVSYSPYVKTYDVYASIEDAKESLRNRYSGYDSFLCCEIDSDRKLVNIRKDSCRFPAVTEQATICLYPVVDGVANMEYPVRGITIGPRGGIRVDRF